MKMPTRPQNALMDAALDVCFDVHARPDSPNEWWGSSSYYLSPRRSILYEQRTPLKTKQGAYNRQKRETIAFLKELRSQIDDVLAKIDDAAPDDHDFTWVTSYAYDSKKERGDTP